MGLRLFTFLSNVLVVRVDLLDSITVCVVWCSIRPNWVALGKYVTNVPMARGCIRYSMLCWVNCLFGPILEI